MVSMRNVLAVILGGGVGKRLYPLTKLRAKPAVPIAGKYRLIDVPISNCINSGIQHIAVLTQFNSVSLHRHITQTYTFDDFHEGWVQILAAEQTLRSTDWYQGTADAVRKQLVEILATRAEYTLILAGDHLYRMDYREMFQYHLEKKAQITIGVHPVAVGDAHRFGLLQRNEEGRITAFVEKPRDPEVLKRFVSRDDPERPYIGSMGIYLFNTQVLEEVLVNTTYDDFGSQIIPNSLETYAVYGFDFDGYWEDIGTIRSFYDTNLSLASPNPPFSFHDPERPIYTRPRNLPGTIIDGATLRNALISEGCIIRKAEINNAIIGLRSVIGNDVTIRNTVMMGADYYEKEFSTIDGGIPLGIGDHSYIEGAIVDKNARIGERVTIRPFPRGYREEQENWVIEDGIVVIPKNTVIHPGTTIAPD
ncbi:MAG: glucose-1-phosphate adenylyltransferase [Anaerolineales bacterium]|nr:glucose-1-phosphate adenylyltransferase [Anaerolineales bacterium]MDW8162483.1 glucose-1-phosphate adenylyltransferase [Anaerolineales bacterium]